MPSAVRDLELDLDAFEGPFDLLLTLVLKDQLEPAEIDIAAIVVAFVEHLTSGPRPIGAALRSDDAEASMPSGAVQSTVPSGLDTSATPLEAEVPA